MKDLLDKLSSYNVFNYLLPGILFAYILDSMYSYKLTEINIVIAVFIYYFFGLIISRIGSLILDPVLKKIEFIEFTPYTDFVSASKKDPKIEVLSEMNNMYRTLCGLVLLVVACKAYEKITRQFPILSNYTYCIAAFGLLMLFLFSYKKQTEYIKQRVSANK